VIALNIIGASQAANDFLFYMTGLTLWEAFLGNLRKLVRSNGVLALFHLVVTRLIDCTGGESIWPWSKLAATMIGELHHWLAMATGQRSLRRTYDLADKAKGRCATSRLIKLF
jgi:hypothetical protein